MTRPRDVEIVEGIAWANRLSIMIAESGAGKTFVLLDLEAAVSDDVAWHGREVQHGSVVHIAYEGDAIGLRARAMRQRAGRRLEHLYVIQGREPLAPQSMGERDLVATLEDFAGELATTHRPPIALIVIDTVRASMIGSEDSSEHVSAYLRSIRRVLDAAPGAACILAHHVGWQDGENRRKRERGSSAWRGNCDGTVYLETSEYDRDKGTAQLTLRTLKGRDDELPAPLQLIRRRVELAESNGRGQPVTSCIIERDPRTRDERKAEQERASQAEVQAQDERTLRLIAERPELATSKSTLRAALGGRNQTVIDSVSRLIRDDLILPGGYGKPFRLTAAGMAAMNQLERARLQALGAIS
jgi:hypothetical protein